MSSTNKTANYDLSQYIGTDKPTYLGDYNSDMLKIDTGLKAAADDATTAVSTANTAASTASDAATAASAATTTANTAKDTADLAKTTAESASTTAGTALSAAQAAETAAAANTITNLAPSYDATLTYEVGDLVTHVDNQGSGKLYKCIVPVDTPMEFNINYWDDVTVSEVFEPKMILVNSVNVTGAVTFKDLFESLIDVDAIEFDKEYQIRLLDTSNVLRVYREVNKITSSPACLIFDNNYGGANITIAHIGVDGSGGIFRGVSTFYNTSTQTVDITHVELDNSNANQGLWMLYRTI